MVGIRVHVLLGVLQFRKDNGNNSNDQNLKRQGCVFLFIAQGIGAVYFFIYKDLRNGRNCNGSGILK